MKKYRIRYRSSKDDYVIEKRIFWFFWSTCKDYSVYNSYGKGLWDKESAEKALRNWIERNKRSDKYWYFDDRCKNVGAVAK